MDIRNFHGLAPVLMNETDGGEGGGGGSVASVSDATGITDLAVSPGADVATTDTQDTTGADATSITTAFRAFENGKLSKPVATALQSLRTAHPENAALIRHATNALGVQNRLFSMGLGPNPFKSIEALRGFHDLVGGAEGLKVYKAQSEDVDEQNRLFASGDPQLLKQMTHTRKADGTWVANPAAVSSFAKLVPHAFDMLGAFSPNRYFREVATRMVSHMKTLTFSPDPKHPEQKEELDLPYRMRSIARALASVPVEGGALSAESRASIAEDLNAVQGFLEYLNTLTRLEPEDLEPKVDPNVERLEIERQRRELTEGQFLNARNDLQNGLYRSEWAKLNIATRATPQQQQTIESLFKTNLDVARRALPDYRSRTNSFVESRDQAGYIRFMSEFYNDKLPRLLAKAVKEVLGDGGKVTPKAADTGKTAATPQAAAPQGITKVDGAPETNDMKRGPGGTTFDMMKGRQFIASKNNRFKMPDGSKVKEGTRCTW